MGKRVAILGGGTGGLVAASLLRKGLSRDHQVLLIDKATEHVFSPSLIWLMVGQRRKEQIKRPLSLLERKGIQFIHAAIERIDFEKRKLITAQKEIEFDYLVLSPGADTFVDKCPGFREGALNLYDVEGVESIWQNVQRFEKGRVLVIIPAAPYKCPGAPWEALFTLRAYFQRLRRDVQIDIITPEVAPLGVAGPEIGERVKSLMRARDIGFSFETQISRIYPNKKEVVLQNDKIIPYDLLIGVPPHGLPPFLKDAPVLGETGWIKANPNTLETKLENVFAIGDATSIPLPVGKPLPKAGVFAHDQAKVVAHRIVAQINGMTSKEEFKGNGSCFIELGDGKAVYAGGNFYASPKPEVKPRDPSFIWHWGKVMFEKWWLWKWF